MGTRFRDHFEAKIANLRSAPEFGDCVQYAALKDFLVSVSIEGHAPFPSSPQHGTPATRKPSKIQILDWQTAVEKRILAEARRIQRNIGIAQDRLHEDDNFIRTLQEKACSGFDFTSIDMQQLLSMQKARDLLSMELEEYKSLNCRAFMKILSTYNDVGKGDVYKVFLPQVLEELQLRPTNREVASQAWSEHLDTFFDNAIQDLGAKERSLILESYSMIRNQCAEVHRGSDETKRPTVPMEDMPAPRAWQRMPLPLVRILLTEYSLSHLSRDIITAMVIAVAGIPKAMSYAALADLPITSGIATLYLPALVYALLGSSRQVAISPQSVTSLLLGQIIAETLKGTDFEGDPAQRLGLAMTLTFYTGLVISLFGALNLCFLLNFISKSVLSGFVSASAIIAAAATVKTLLGLHVKKSPILYILVERMMADLSHIHWPTALISAAGITFLFLMPRVQKRAVRRLKAVEHPLARGLYFVARVPTVLYLMAFGILLGSCLCSFQPFNEWQVEHLVVGRGATAPALYFQHMSGRFNCSHYLSRAASYYQPTSSGDGLNAGTANTFAAVQFAASDVRPPEDAGLLTLPVLSTFVCAVVNLPFLADSQQINLVLDPPTVAAIFAGEVRMWSDPRIKRANPNLPWESFGQNAPISVIVRGERSGTTAAFAEGLLSCAQCNSSLWTPGLRMEWGASEPLAVKGNVGVVEAVASTPWSIGYATYGAVEAAADTNARCLAWHMDDDKVITPGLAWRYPDKFSWPVPLTSYVLVPNLNRSSCQARSWLKTMLEALYSYEGVAHHLGYRLSPRPAEVDTVACEGDDIRRLAASEGAVPSDFKCSLPAPTCGQIQVVGYIDASLPRPTIPDAGVHLEMSTKITFALMLAAVALLEHVANVKLYADREGYSVNMEIDLVAVGAANMIGALFGSFVVAGGFSRSALNEKAASQMSLLLSVLISFFVVFAISSLLSMLPDAILNIILFCAVVPLVDIKTVVALTRLGRHGFIDLLALTVAFVATCFLGVVQGMLLAITVSLVEFIWKSLFPQISELHRTPGSLHYAPAEASEAELGQVALGPWLLRMPRCSRISVLGVSSRGATIKVLRFEAPLWFANAANLSDRLLSELKGPALQGVALDMSTVPWMDITAANILKQALMAAKERDVFVVFASVKTDVRYFLEKVCLVQQEQLVRTLYAAEMAIKAILPKCDQPSTQANLSETPV